MRTLFVSMLLFIVSLTADAVNISGNERGVQFFYLDSQAHDFPWVLNHQEEPAVRAKLDALLQKYNDAGVNWIRLLVGANHFGAWDVVDGKVVPRNYPNPNQDQLVSKVNRFMEITRSNGNFTIEIVLVTPTDPHTSSPTSGYYLDPITNSASYENDKTWLRHWIAGLQYSNLGIIMITGDAVPCIWDGAKASCEGDVNAHPLARNHGLWLKTMWPWVKDVFPGLNISYEVAGGGNSKLEFQVIKRLVKWVNTNTNSVPVVAAAVYPDVPPGRDWIDYALYTDDFLRAYQSVAFGKPLWIDEYGLAAGNGSNYSNGDKLAFYQGFLGASICSWQQYRFPKFAWVAGNDGSSNNPIYGLVSSFDGSVPIMNNAWYVLKQYYLLQSC